MAKLEKKENHSIAKAIDIDEWIQKANFPVGTVRTWNGQKFKKITPKKWARVYETESKGAKLAVAALRRKAAACRNSEELLQLCLENMERFRDNNGHPLPFMQEFSEYVSGLNDAHEKGAAKGKKIDEIWNQQQARIKELRKKGYSDEQIDNDDVIKQTKKDMQDLDKEPAKEEPKKTEPKQDNKPPKTDNEPNKKDIESIREKYQSSLSVEGDEDEIYVGKEAIQGKWKLVEADAPSASHDEITFHKTEGFPTAKDGSTVNDRDYEHDTAAQETVIDIASDFDGRALGFDSPIVVTQDGVVTSGNNRTMSSKIAARKGTDKSTSKH